MYSQHFMTNLKVILHDIFYDTSVNFLCNYSLLYPADMCDVTYIEVYNTYVHGICFLSTLYNNICCLMPPQSTLLFVSSDSGSHVYATSRSSSLRRDRHHTSCRNTACSMFAIAVNTHDIAIVSFGRPKLWMLYFQSTELGHKWTWSTPWNDTSCQIFYLQNQISNRYW